MILIRGRDRISIQKVVEGESVTFVGSINGVVVMRADDGAITLMVLLFKLRGSKDGAGKITNFVSPRLCQW
jgi:hypothetical protein